MTGLRPLRALAFGIVMIGAVIALFAFRDLGNRAAPPSDMLGAILAPTAPGGPLVVDSLRADGAARRSGLHVGDEIEDVDGRPARSQGDVARALAEHTQVVVHIRRLGHSLQINLQGH